MDVVDLAATALAQTLPFILDRIELQSGRSRLAHPIVGSPFPCKLEARCDRQESHRPIRGDDFVPGVNPGTAVDGEVRRFACTSCGKCCDRGPEMELSEATALSDIFVTSLIFKARSVPISARTDRAAQWWREQGSRIPLRAAFEEKRRHMAIFASRRRSDRRNEREVYLDISAIVDDYRKDDARR